MAADASPKRRTLRWIVLILLLVVLGTGSGIFIFLRLHGREARYCRRGELYLQNGNPFAALLEFRAALALNPKRLEARVGAVRALAGQKEFARALAELDKALRDGLEAGEAALLKARVLDGHAEYRLTAPGEKLTAMSCEKAIAEDVDPAVELAANWADKVKDPPAAYVVLGGLLTLKAKIITREMDLTWSRSSPVEDFQTSGELTANEQDQIRAAMQRILQVESSAVAAYAEAVRRDPGDVQARLAIAQYALEAYVPRTDEAAAVLEPLMRLKPVPPDALSEMATAEWYAGKYDRALELLRTLTSANPNELSYLIAEAEILTEAQRWPEALEAARKLANLSHDNPHALYLMGRALLHEDRPQEAADYLQDIFLDPKVHWPQARLALAEALMKFEQPRQAVNAYRRVLEDRAAIFIVNNIRTERELQEAQYQSWVALARAEEIVGPKAAMGYAASALAIFPARPEALQVAQEVYQAAGAPPEAIEGLILVHASGLLADPGQHEAARHLLETEYAKFKKTPSRGVHIGLMLGRMLADEGSYREAIAAYEGIRKDFPRTAAYELAQLHVRFGHDDEARAAYESILESDPRDAQALVGLMGVLVRMNDWDRARAVIERTAAESDSEEVWAAMMDICLHRGRLEDAVSAARSHVEKNPSNPVAQAELAELLWQYGDLKGARIAFDVALALAPDYLYANRRALLDLEEDRPADAVTLLRRLLEKSATPAAKIDLAVALQAAGQTREAADLLQGVSSAFQGPSKALDAPRWYLAVLRAGEGDIQAAGAMNDLLAAKDYFGLPADRLQLLQRIAASEEKARREAAAKLNLVIWLIAHNCPGTLQQAELVVKLLPGEPLPVCWRIRLLDFAGKHDEAVKAYRDLITVQPGFLLARTLLADSLRSHGKAEEAVQVLEESLSVAKPDEAAWVQLRLAPIREEQGRLDEAIAGYRAAISQPSCAAQACNNLALLYATRRNDPDSALPLARQAAQLAGNDPAILDTLGWVLYLKGDNDQALQILSKAKAGLPNLPTVRYHLGMALLKAGRPAEAKTEFQEALTISKDFPEVNDAAAQFRGI